jgi:protocatechuate 3,4-dioxygenase beta subunit
MRFFLSVTIGFALATLSDAGITQSPSISGRVVDAAATPVPGAFVTISDESGGTPARATTGRDGTYRFAALRDGTYRIDFELTGFDSMRRNHVQVRTGTSAIGDMKRGFFKLDAASAMQNRVLNFRHCHDDAATLPAGSA